MTSPAITLGGQTVIEVPLTRGRFGVIDIEDADLVLQYKWFYQTRGYAAHTLPTGQILLMHRLIMEAPEGMSIDHKNCDRLDNRRSNLRLCTQQQNSYNRPASVTNKSGFKGVYKRPGRNTWVAEIRAAKVKYKLGYFKTAEDAAKAYSDAARLLHGDFANLGGAV